MCSPVFMVGHVGRFYLMGKKSRFLNQVIQGGPYTKEFVTFFGQETFDDLLVASDEDIRRVHQEIKQSGNKPIERTWMRWVSKIGAPLRVREIKLVRAAMAEFANGKNDQIHGRLEILDADRDDVVITQDWDAIAEHQIDEPAPISKGAK